MQQLLMRKVNVVRYLTPLREGGSLPAIAEDEMLTKFYTQQVM